MQPAANESVFQSVPRLGEPAPVFEAETTHGWLQLDDFRGSWLVLFSHPADFTPVCTTEFIALAKAAPRLRAQGVELLGLSVDSIYSHLAWTKEIERRFAISIPFPIIADGDRKVSTQYGMIMPGQSGTETVRSVFVIDPDGVVRASLTYPMTTGRNIAEIERLVTALQTSDAHHVATPADWQPGQRVIVPAPRTAEDAAAPSPTGEHLVDWWYRERDLPSQ